MHDEPELSPRLAGSPPWNCTTHAHPVLGARRLEDYHHPSTRATAVRCTRRATSLTARPCAYGRGAATYRMTPIVSGPQAMMTPISAADLCTFTE